MEEVYSFILTYDFINHNIADCKELYFIFICVFKIESKE